MAARIARRHLIAVAPAGSDLAKVYYHGTASEKAGQSILRSGIRPPDLPVRLDSFQPVAGKVYLTPQLPYAIAYALGGETAELFLRQGPTHMYPPVRDDEWGYLFVVPGRELVDIQPDEDSVGAMIGTSDGPSWLTAMAQKMLRSRHLSDKPGFLDWEEWALFRNIDLFELSTEPGMLQLRAQAEAGKILLPEMSPAQHLELIARGAHVAHQGKVEPSECWKIRKSDAPLLKRDGTNFFHLAERCR